MGLPYRSCIKLILKFAVTAGLFWYLAMQIRAQTGEGVLTHLSNDLATLNFWFVAAAVALYSSSVVVSGYRWSAVAGALRVFAPLSFFIRQYYVGMWFSQALPSGIGGDVVKAVVLAKKTGRRKASVVSVLLERASGLGALVGIVAVCLPILWQLFGAHPIFWFLAAFVAGGLAAVGVLAGAVRFPQLYRMRVTRFFWRLSRDVNRAFFSSWEVLAVQVLTSAYVQLASIGAMWCAAQALGNGVDFTVMMALCPPVFLLLVLPISFAGWGVREGAVVGLFTLAGVLNASDALALSLLYGGITLLTSLPGSLFWMWTQQKPTLEEP